MKEKWKRQFAIVYAGQAFSIIGSATVHFSVIWWLTTHTGSAITLTTAAISGFLPYMLFGPFAGIWADRYNRRLIMIAADLFIALTSLLLAITFWALGTLPVWFIYVILFMRGLGGAFHAPAMQASIPLLVPHEKLTKAGGWGNLIQSASNMLGPVFGAALMGFYSIASIMFVDIIGAIVAVLCLLFVKIPNIPKSREASHIFTEFKQGLAAISENRPLMAVYPPIMLCFVVTMPLAYLFPLLVHTHFNGTALHNGIAEFIFAGGLLTSSLIMGVWGATKRRFLMVSLAMAVLGGCALVSGAMPSTGFTAFAALCFFMGCANTFIAIPITAYTQETVAPANLGKVLSLYSTAMTVSVPIGLLIAGPISERIGVNGWFLCSGILIMMAGAACWWRTRNF